MVPSVQKGRLIVPLNRLRVRAIVLVHIIAWSGFNSLDPEERAVHAKMRAEEIAGSQAEILLPVAENLNIAAHDIVTIISHGRAALSIFGNRTRAKCVTCMSPPKTRIPIGIASFCLDGRRHRPTHFGSSYGRFLDEY